MSENEQSKTQRTWEPTSTAADAHVLSERIGTPSNAPPSSRPSPRESTVEPAPWPESEPAYRPSVRPPVAPTARGHRAWWPFVAVGVGAVLVLFALSSTGYLAYSNKTRADDWEERAAALERNIDELNAVLIDRSSTLDARTRELNRMAITVKQQERALRRSEADVSSLSARQRALAAEKAAVEDSRAQLAVQASALENVADAFVDCKDGLVDLLGYVLNEDYFSAEAIVTGVADDCQYAESSLSSYNATYP